MSGFVFHPGALADLTEIWEYIAADSLAAADRVVEEIREGVRSVCLPVRPPVPWSAEMQRHRLQQRFDPVPGNLHADTD
jgi:plasmid stabilization system protein ParE